MKCRTCGEADWRPYGSYRSAGGQRRRRFCCRVCGRRQAEHADTADFGLSAGGEADDASAYRSFFQSVADETPGQGLTNAIFEARWRTRVSEATASRWVREVALEGADRGTGARPFPPLEGISSEWRAFLAECLDVYRSSPSLPSNDELAAFPLQDTQIEWRASPPIYAEIWRALGRARAMAALIGRYEFPDWLARYVPQEAGVPRRILDDPDDGGEADDGLVDLEWHIRRQSRRDMWNADDADEWLRRWTCDETVLDEVDRLFHARTEEGKRIWIGPVEVWPLIFMVPRTGTAILDTRPPDSLDPDELSAVLERVLNELNPDPPAQAIDPPYALRYWIRYDHPRLEVLISTRSRVIGRSGFDVELDGKGPWAARLHVKRRTEAALGIGDSATNVVVIPLSLRRRGPTLVLKRP